MYALNFKWNKADTIDLKSSFQSLTIQSNYFMHMINAILLISNNLKLYACAYAFLENSHLYIQQRTCKWIHTLTEN